MSKISSDKKQVGIAAVVFTLLFLFLYPTNFLVADELFYFQQGVTYASGKTFMLESIPFSDTVKKVSPGQYPLGLPLTIAGLLSLFGRLSIFLTGFVSLLAALFFTAKTLENLRLPPRFALLLFWYFPAVLLSRTVMSDVPSMAFIALFVYLVTLEKYKSSTLFLAGLTASLSVLFREPNLLLTLPFLVGISLRRRGGSALFICLGLAIGLGVKLAATNWAFGSPFFTKDPGMPFSWVHLGKNLLFYLPFLLVFIPTGLWSAIRYKGKFRLEIQVALALFLSLYLLYSYNGTHFSGVKSLVLGPRFLIPTLPIFAICVASFSEKHFTFLSKMLLPVALLSLICVQVMGHFYNAAQNEIFQNLNKRADKIHLLTEVYNLPKIYLPQKENIQLYFLKDSLPIDKILARDTFFYLETSFRSDTKQTLLRSEKRQRKLYDFLEQYQYEETYSGNLPDKTIVKQFKVYN